MFGTDGGYWAHLGGPSRIYAKVDYRQTNRRIVSTLEDEIYRFPLSVTFAYMTQAESREDVEACAELRRALFLLTPTFPEELCSGALGAAISAVGVMELWSKWILDWQSKTPLHILYLDSNLNRTQTMLNILSVTLFPC